MTGEDVYRTIRTEAQGEVFKDKGSKFFGFTYPVLKEDEIKGIIQSLKEIHPKARHWCYAWRLGAQDTTYRYNDDGEPSNSAGNPIYGQILSENLTNILIVVVRYFGGTKLGVGGLINAYRTSARKALDESEIIVKTIDTKIVIQFEYSKLNSVMRMIKEKNVKILHQDLQMTCQVQISVRNNKVEEILDYLKDIRIVKITVVD